MKFFSNLSNEHLCNICYYSSTIFFKSSPKILHLLFYDLQSRYTLIYLNCHCYLSCYGHTILTFFKNIMILYLAIHARGYLIFDFFFWFASPVLWDVGLVDVSIDLLLQLPDGGEFNLWIRKWHPFLWFRRDKQTMAPQRQKQGGVERGINKSYKS